MAKIDTEIKSLFEKVKIKLGAPVRSIPLSDDTLCTLLETCVEDYAKIVQEWLIETNWSSIWGKDLTTNDMAFSLSVRNLDYSKDYSYWFSKEVGLQQRGGYELKKDFITIERGKQSYIIPKNREINKVLYCSPPMTPVAAMAQMGGMDMAFGNGLGGGIAQVGGGMGGMGTGNGFFAMQAYDTLLIASDLQMKTRMLRGDLTFKVTALASGEKVLHLMSTPGSSVVFGGQYGAGSGGMNMEGYHVWYTYYDVKNEKDANKCRKLNPDVLISPDQFPLEDLEYTFLNSPTKTLIRQLLIAEAKITLGLIYGRNSGEVSIPDAIMKIDYQQLAEQGKDEKEKIIQELRDRLTRLAPLAQSENNKNIALNMMELSKLKPVSGWVMI